MCIRDRYLSEEQILALLNETVSDTEDFSASESEYELSEHESISNESGGEGHDATYSVSSNFYYGKNRYKWSKYPALRGNKPPRHNIIRSYHFPGIIGEARNITCTF